MFCQYCGKEIIQKIETATPGSKDRALSALQHLPHNPWNITTNKLNNKEKEK